MPDKPIQPTDNTNPKNAIQPASDTDKAIMTTIAPEGGPAPVRQPSLFTNVSNTVIPSVIAFDEVGRLWGAGPGGVINWHLATDRVVYQTYHSAHGLAGQDITCLHIDSNHICTGHVSGRISVMIIDQKQWKVLPRQAADGIQALATMPNGDLLALTETGIFWPDSGAEQPLPIVPITAAVSAKQIYIGAHNGLWLLDEDGQLHPKQIGSPVMQLARTADRLWFGGPGGLSMIFNDGTIPDWHWDKHIVQIAADPSSDEVHALTADSALYRIDSSGTSLLNIAKDWMSIEQIAITKRWVAFGNTDELYAHNRHRQEPPLRLSPDASHMVPNGIRVIASGGTVLMQAEGKIYQRDGEDWQQILIPNTAELLTCSHFIGGDLTLVMRGPTQDIVGTVHEGVFTRQSDLPFHNIAAAWVDEHNDILHIIAVEREPKIRSLRHFHTTNVIGGWRRGIPIPHNCGSVIALGPGETDGSPTMVTSRGLYTLDSSSPRTIFDTEVITAVWRPDGTWVVTDGEILVDPATKDILRLPEDSNGTITALTWVNDLLCVGTSAGLWCWKPDSWHRYTIEDGLPSDIITCVSFCQNHLYTATELGMVLIPIDSILH